MLRENFSVDLPVLLEIEDRLRQTKLKSVGAVPLYRNAAE